MALLQNEANQAKRQDKVPFCLARIIAMENGTIISGDVGTSEV